MRLAQALGLSAVAEGVETPEQLEQLALLGCELAQGFLWSRPLPAEHLAVWLENFEIAPLPRAENVDTDPTIRVLLVDDQPAVRDLIRLTMLLEGCFDVIAEASNGADAIELAGTHQPDLVVLDLLMPVLDGAEALPRILAAAPNATIVVVQRRRTGCRRVRVADRRRPLLRQDRRPQRGRGQLAGLGLRRHRLTRAAAGVTRRRRRRGPRLEAP